MRDVMYVLGLASHPRRPFVMASSSRDSTVRIWSLTSLVQPIEINLLIDKPLTSIVATEQTSSAPNSGPLLCGKVSADIKAACDKLKGRASKLKLFSKFFTSPGGAQNLWELVTVSLGVDESLTSSAYTKGIIHTKHLTKFKAAVAQELEMVRISKFGSGITREEHLREAASIHIKLGNLQRYCEILVELGEWQKALSVAPGVSLKYWQSLAKRYQTQLLADNHDDAIAMCVSTGNAKSVVDLFISRGQLQDALLVATASSEGSIKGANILANNIPPHRLNSVPNDTGADPSDDRLLLETCDILANFHFRSGSPALAACCHLTVDDYKKCLSKLIRGHELELAVNISQVLGTGSEQCVVAVELLSRRCEKLGHWELGIELLQTLPKPDLLMAKLCARCAASMAEIDQLHALAGLPNMEQCLVEADKLYHTMSRGVSAADGHVCTTAPGGQVFECVKFYLLSTTPDVGLQIGLSHVKAIISRLDWKVSEVFDLLQLLACIQTEKLQQHKLYKLRAELLILTGYVASLMAIRKKYYSIVVPMFKHTRFLMDRDRDVDIPLSESLVTSELEAWQAYYYTTISNNRAHHSTAAPGAGAMSLTPDREATIDVMLVRLGDDDSPIELGADCVSGSTLPCHSDVHYSSLTQQCIQGPVFFLEDGRSAIAISDAIMWAKVNPFSPLGSAVRINPF